MIKVSSKKNKYTYNVYHLVKAFFPNEEIIQNVDEKQESLVALNLPGGSCFSIALEEVEAAAGDLSEMETEEAKEQAIKKELTRLLYRYLEQQTRTTLAWGTLTGVRPTKLAMTKLEQYESMTEAEAVRRTVGAFRDEFFVSEEKAQLACEIAVREKKLLSKLDYKDGFSLYVGIPFCPSVCSYCSFSSSPIAEWKDKVESYLFALLKEIRAIGKMSEGHRPDSVYIGGGTPTTLEAEQMDRLLKTITENFDLSNVLEFTVEAGRPDSITEEKLAVIRKYPVTRISINPQTMQQKTLDLVGRNHTVAQTKDAFYLARKLGFDNINMDLIAGLPGEDASDMEDTLRQVEEMHPDSLTIHALAIKRAARYGQEGRKQDLHSEISQMIMSAADCAKRIGLQPYYLYRQKNIAGNFESIASALAHDATKPLPVADEAYDLIFIDAPCTGLGTLRRHPEIKARLHKEDAKKLSATSQAMLVQAAPKVKLGGYLMFATCTILKEENEKTVKRFLASPAGSAFEIVPLGAQGTPFFKTPFDTGADLHFAALLQKKR